MSMQYTIKVIIDTLAVSDKVLNNNCSNTKNMFLGLPVELSVPFLILLIGIIGNWIIRKVLRRNRLLVIKDTVINWIELLRKPVNDKVYGMNDFRLRVHKTDIFQYESFDCSKTIVEKLSVIPLKEYTDSFVLNMKGDRSINSQHLFNIISSIETMSAIEDDILVKYGFYHQTVVELMDSLNMSVQKLEEIRLLLHLNFGRRESENYLFYQKFCEILNKYTAIGGISVKLFRNIIIEPLYALIDEEINSNFNPNYTVDIYNELKKIDLILAKFDSRNTVIAGSFNEYAIIITDSYNVLRTASDHFKEKGLKPWYWIN